MTAQTSFRVWSFGPSRNDENLGAFPLGLGRCADYNE
jgi:hypothetical protein